MYHFQINGIDVTCETAEELHAIANFHLEQPRPPITVAEVRNELRNALDEFDANKAEHHKQNGHIDGRTKMWEWLNNYRQERGCSVKQARNAYRKMKAGATK